MLREITWVLDWMKLLNFLEFVHVRGDPCQACVGLTGQLSEARHMLL